MAKGKGKLTMGRRSSRGPAKQVNTDGGIKNTVAGKKVKSQPGGGAKAAAKVPGATSRA